MHVDQGIQLAKNNINLMIEKPLDSNLDRISELNDIVNEKNLTVMMEIFLDFHHNKDGKEFPV